MLRLAIAIICVVLSTPSRSAGNIAATPESSVLEPRQLSLEAWHIGLDQGMANTRINGVLQASDGTLWISGFGGLFNYNGSQFRQYKTKNIPEVGRSLTGLLAEDSKGRIWLRAGADKFAYYEDGVFHKVTEPVKGIGITAWCSYGDGSMLAAVFNNGYSHFYTFNGVSWDSLEIKIKGGVSNLLEDENGNYVFLVNEQPWRLKEKHAHALKIPSNSDVTTLCKLDDGSLLAIGRKGIYSIQHEILKTVTTFETPFKGRARPREALDAGEGKLWIRAPYRGLFLVNLEGQLTKMQPSRGRLPDIITTIYRDHEGNLWCGTFDGLVQLRFSPFVSWQVPIDLSSSLALKVKQGINSDIWFSGYGGICRLRPSDPRPELIIPRESNEVTNFDIAPDGSVFLANKDLDFSHYRDGELIPMQLDANGKHFVLTHLVSDHDSVPWISSYKGVFRAEKDGEQLVYKKASGKNGLPDTSYQRLICDESGQLYAFTKGKGVYRKQPDQEQWIRYDTGTKFPDRGPAAIDRDGRIWSMQKKLGWFTTWHKGNEHRFALEGQLERLKTGVANIACDHNGDLWFCVSRIGVAHIQAADLLAFAKNPTLHIPVQWFTTHNGLPSNGFSYTNLGSLTTNDGSIWIATSKGLSRIDPDLWRQQKSNALAPEVRLSSIHTNGIANSISQGGQIMLTPGDNRLDLTVHTSSFGFQDETHYRYRFKGDNTTWTQAGTTGTLSFQQLAVGQYVLEIAANNRYGDFADNSLQLPIHVQPYWWQRSWISFCGVALAALLVGLIYRKRVRILNLRSAQQSEFSRALIQSQEDERKRIAGELHDGLGQHLLLIKNSTELVRRKMKDTAKEKERMGEITDIAANAIQEVRSITSNLRPVGLDRLGLETALRIMIERISRHAEIEADLQLEALSGDYDEAYTIAIFRLVQEAVNNVIKHAQATHLSVYADCDSQGLSITIKDDGHGFNPATCDRRIDGSGMGLTGMEERSKLLGGSLSVKSTPGQGTRIEIRFPL